MRTLFKIQLPLLAVLISARMSDAAEPVKALPTKPVPAMSVFTMPTSAKDGRDPFFPDSTRIFDANVPAATATVARTVEITALKLKGYSMVNNQPIVIINNHSFMIGDEGDVLTTSGRVHVRCLNIRPSVVNVEVNGQRQDLHF